MKKPAGANAYLLGHADTEIQRLLLQGRLYNDHTEHALRLAGVQPGMRVLDVGCGPGDVSFVAARLVGSTGTVLGVDASSDVVEFARARAAERGLSTVKFEHTTIADIAVDEVDAVIGRLILMHLPDPISTLRQFAGLVRPGGLIAFCEFDIGAVRSIPESPLSRALVDAIVRAFQGVGLDPAFGAALHTLFRRAGLGVPQLTLAAPVGTANDTEVWAYAVEVWRLVFPLAEQLGLVTDELADIDTLLPRTLEQATVADAILMLPPMITAWTTVRSN
ncbi:MAG TPA: class I SAM-dependent methyltransferase [Mycobacterium sp.]|nr:class I SAM-dependent methyltransferase [Mycobacterium sp.]